MEISIFSLYNVTVRLTKIMNNLLEHLKILIFQVIGGDFRKILWPSQNIWTLMNIFLNTLFSKNVPKICCENFLHDEVGTFWPKNPTILLLNFS